VMISAQVIWRFGGVQVTAVRRVRRPTHWTPCRWASPGYVSTGAEVDQSLSPTQWLLALVMSRLGYGSRDIDTETGAGIMRGSSRGRLRIALWAVLAGLLPTLVAPPASASTLVQVRRQLQALHLVPLPLFPARLVGEWRGTSVSLESPSDCSNCDYGISFSRDGTFLASLRRGGPEVLGDFLNPRSNDGGRSERVRVGSRIVYMVWGRRATMAWHESGRTYWVFVKWANTPPRRLLSELVASLRPLPSVAPRPDLSILVLGDSYSAGNGAGDYFGAKGCWRSRRNYAQDYAHLIEARPIAQRAAVTNAACSGATTSWFFNSEHGRRPELDASTRATT
jgi:hypothetical protein